MISQAQESLTVKAARVLLHRGDDGGEPVSKNDQGFNKPDYSVVKRLIADLERGGKIEQAEWILNRILPKYHRQLIEIGLPLTDLASVEPQRWIDLLPKAEAPRRTTTCAVVTNPDPFAAKDDIPDEPRQPNQLPPMESIMGSDSVISHFLPNYEARPTQVKIAQAVADAISTKSSILAEAGTGTGKSMAYLAPAIISGLKTIVSTEGKALQDQLALKDLPFLASALPVAFTFTVLKGLSNYACLRGIDEETAAAGMLGGDVIFDDIRAWLNETQTGDLAELTFPISNDLRSRITTTNDECDGKDCPFATQCWAMRARARAKTANVVVNHTLLSLDLALRAMSDDAAAILPDRDLIVVDEAHSLEDVATKAFTFEITSGSIPSLLRGRLAGRANLDPGTLQDLNDESSAFFTYVGRDDRAQYAVTPNHVLTTMAERIIAKLSRVALTVNRSALNETDTVWMKRLERYAKRIEGLADRFKIALEDPDLAADYVLFAENQLVKGQRRITSLKAAPISVAEILKSALWNRWPTIATSATLSTSNNFRFIRARTGCDSAKEISVLSPFDYPKNALIYLPANASDLDPSRFYQEGNAEYFKRLAAEIKALVLASSGRAFCLFTSRKALDQVYDQLAYDLPYPILKQGEYATQEMTKRFRAEASVLFGLRTFMTGVDIQGDALSLVIIDKLPFPSPDEPIYAARCDRLNRDASNEWAWFNGLAIPLATITLKQAAGRLIRTKADRGVIALLDGRLSTKRYGAGVIQSLPPAKVVRSLDQVRAFYRID